MDAPHLDAVASGQTWYDLDLLREGAAVFTALSHDHITLEVSLMYPEARARLVLASDAKWGEKWLPADGRLAPRWRSR